MSKITTTAYAMLGLLSTRAISTYELARRMRFSNLRAFWPRAESQVYKEPKKLATLGLAEANVEYKGDRKRTVYRATERGREALREWLGQPSDRFSYRYEAMIKVAFANSGTIEDLRRTVSEVRSEAEQDAQTMLEVAEAWADESSPVPEREHLNALADAFILEIIEARLRWAETADRYIAGWTSSEVSETSRRQAKALWQEFEERLRKLLADADPADPYSDVRLEANDAVRDRSE